MGIHNEPGFKTLSPIPPLDKLIDSLVQLIVATDDPERSFLPFSGVKDQDEVVLLVNNLGGISELELGAVSRESVKNLQQRGIKVRRILSGSFMVRG